MFNIDTIYMKTTAYHFFQFHWSSLTIENTSTLQTFVCLRNPVSVVLSAIVLLLEYNKYTVTKFTCQFYCGCQWTKPSRL